MALFLGAALALCVLGLLCSRKTGTSVACPESSSSLPALMGILLIGYSAFLILSVSLFDAVVLRSDPDRALSPLFIPMLLLILFLVHKVLQGPRPVRIFAVACCIVFAAFSGKSAAIFLRYNHAVGRGYTQTTWTGSRTLASVKELPGDTRIFTNDRYAIYLLTGRLAADLPADFDVIRSKPLDAWPARVRAMGRELGEHGGVIVLLDNSCWQDIGKAELEQFLKLRPIAREEDGGIYAVDSVLTQPSVP
jgi:hypothetical protein